MSDSHKLEDQQFEALLSQVDRGRTDPSDDFLDRTRGASTAAFERAQASQVKQKDRPMSFSLVRFGLLAAAVAVVFALFVSQRGHDHRRPPTLGELLQNATNQGSLHLQVERSGQKRDIWIDGEKLRVEDSSHEYQIGSQDSLWSVDEQQNKAVKTPSPYYRTDWKTVDLLKLTWDEQLPDLRSDIYDALPVGLVEENGVQYLRYELTRNSGKSISVLAYFELESKRFQRIQMFGDDPQNAATLTLVAFNPPANEGRFIVKAGLTDDGHAALVRNWQGICFTREALSRRWTPLAEPQSLRPGDWIRTSGFGANGVVVQMSDGSELTLGPKTTAIVESSDSIRLVEGEAEVVTRKKKSFTVINGQQTLDTKGTQFLRLEVNETDGTEKLVKLKKTPPWLKGFRAAVPSEQLGSLVCNVDDRDISLTVGYHKVSVDIRDQISRTVIEESFVNNTKSTLEGVFYFPLPQGASISGFGMWINGELVEADVVEKQRARQIYETILRERRDPGLLEWTGGNIFKARVFPIFGHSEKRIKITYTQPLTLKGNEYRYSYGLRSELLQKNPLRNLDIQVRIHNELEIEDVSVPGFNADIRKTARSASVDFSAQNFTPKKDLEVRVRIPDNTPQITMIPHQRGDDGYFMMMFRSPDFLGNWKRKNDVPQPLDLLILADTSGSMDPTQRRQQQDFINAILSSLDAETDTVNVATVDAYCQWLFDDRVSPTRKNVNRIVKHLKDRPSLGWTDLTMAMSQSSKRIGENTHVVYVGDGIVNTYSADPIEFSNFLNLTYGGVTKGKFHSVSVGSKYESVVLAAISRQGSGTVHHISDTDVAAKVAADWLASITNPSIENLKVSFEGIETARVYPNRLPNLGPQAQHVVIGRFLPRNKSQQGTVLVDGTFAGKPVSFKANVELGSIESNGEQSGNSFIPRLWARMHLDALLEQGSDPRVQEDIIALSERFNIMTPYTSLLILESDADRARFKVKRRFQMRDGERFFADGQKKQQLDLLQQQMNLASQWRLGLRQSVLGGLREMGRDTRQIGEISGIGYGSGFGWGGMGGGGGGFAGGGGFFGAPASGSGTTADEYEMDEESNADFNGPADSRGPGHSHPGPGDEMGGEEDARMELKGRGNSIQFLPPGTGTGKGGRFDVDKLFKVKIDEGRTMYGADFLDLLPQFPLLHFGHSGQTEWDKESLELANSLLRVDYLKGLKNGLHIKQIERQFFLKDEAHTYQRENDVYFTPATWTMVDHTRERSLVHWKGDGQAGVYSRAFLWGRTRKTTDDDQLPPLTLFDASIGSLAEEHIWRTSLIEHSEIGVPNLLVVSEHNEVVDRYKIDEKRRVILEHVTTSHGKVTQRRVFSEFQQIEGRWWAQLIEIRNAEDKLIRQITCQVESIDAEKVTASYKSLVGDPEKLLLLQSPFPSKLELRGKAAKGTASRSDLLRLIGNYANEQRWQHVHTYLTRLERLSPKSSAVKWLRDAVAVGSRNGEELRKRLDQRVAELVSEKSDSLEQARRITELATHLLSATESLKLFVPLRPVYQRQPEWKNGADLWQYEYAAALDRAEQYGKATGVHLELANKFPRHYDYQRTLLQAYRHQGRTEEWSAKLESLLARRDEFTKAALNDFVSQKSRFLQQQRKYAEFIDFIDRFEDAELVNRHWLRIYLRSLLLQNKRAQAIEVAAKWLADVSQEEVSDMAIERGVAAVDFGIGQAYEFPTTGLVAELMDAISKTCEVCIGHSDRREVATRVLSHSRFRDTPHGLKLMAKLANRVADVVAHKSIREAAVTLQILQHFPESLSTEAWDELRTSFLRRVETAATDKEADKWLAALLDFTNDDHEQHVPLLRKRWKLTESPAHAEALLEALLEQTWSEESEKESLKLIPHVQNAGRKAWQVYFLHRWVDSMLVGRETAAAESLDELRKMSRNEEAASNLNAKDSAKQGVIKTLEAAVATLSPNLTEWVELESHQLSMQLNRVDRGWKETLLTRLKAAPPVDNFDEDDEAASLHDYLSKRYMWMSLRIALADSKKADVPFLSLLRDFEDTIGGTLWRAWLTKTLLAVDRQEELFAHATHWHQTDKADYRWRRMLAYLSAERGDLATAVSLMEGELLSAGAESKAYKTVAEWALVLGQKEKYTQLLNKSVEEKSISVLENWLHNLDFSDEQTGSIELTDEMLAGFVQLIQRSRYVEQSISQLSEAYKQTGDFRLLRALADGCIGHSNGRVYAGLSVLPRVLQHVHDEATVDEIMQRLTEIRLTAANEVDHRALDLLEMFTQSRAAQVVDQPGPHVAAALAALKRSVNRQWRENEQVDFAEFLAKLGRLNAESLAAEQVGQLKKFYDQAVASNSNRFQIGSKYARCLWTYDRKDDSILLLETELQHLHTSKETIPVELVEQLLKYLVERGRWLNSERLLKRYRDEMNGDRHWVQVRLSRMYTEAMKQDGTVSLGKGKEIFLPLAQFVETSLEVFEDNHYRELLNEWQNVYYAANQLKIKGVLERATKFAQDRFLDIVQQHPIRYRDHNYHIMLTISRLIPDGPDGRKLASRSALRYGIEAIERRPEFTRDSSEYHMWPTFHNQMSDFRLHGAPLPKDIEKRLLAIVVDYLRADLISLEGSNREPFHFNYSNFWREKADAFLAVAENVIKENGDNPWILFNVAEYLHHGLQKYERANEVATNVYKAGKLPSNLYIDYAEMLVHLQKYDAALEVVRKATPTGPDESTIDLYAVCFIGLEKEKELSDLAKMVIEKTESGEYDDYAAQSLTSVLVEDEHFKLGLDVITANAEVLRRKYAANQDYAEGLRSTLMVQSQCYAGLKNVGEAVNSLTEAMSYVLHDADEQEWIRDNIQSVLSDSSDLAEYTKYLDKQATKEGVERPIVRQALGQALLEESMFEEALVQLKIALEYSPNDSKLHDRIIETYEQLARPRELVEAQLNALDIHRRDLDWLGNVVDSMESNGRRALAELVRTQLVESLPNESEGHQQLAKMRMRQRRYEESMRHWRQVIEIRKLEPTGLIGLAEAQILAGERYLERARITIDKIRADFSDASANDLQFDLQRLESLYNNPPKPQSPTPMPTGEDPFAPPVKKKTAPDELFGFRRVRLQAGSL